MQTRFVYLGSAAGDQVLGDGEHLRYLQQGRGQGRAQGDREGKLFSRFLGKPQKSYCFSGLATKKR